jgi:hypothetical protein
MAGEFVEFDEAGFHHVFTSWDGPVGGHVAKAARSIEIHAMSHVGFDTGRLLSSIDSVFYNINGELAVRTGANPMQDGVVGYALYHHQGTRPHKIVARNAQFLRFPDSRTGQIRYARSVHHPGTKANRYLTQPLREVIR